MRDAEDLTGDVFVRVARNLHEFKGDSAALRRWVFTIAHHRLVDEYRLMVTPDLFGEGTRLFEKRRGRLGLTLLEAKPLDTGAVILHYRRDRKS